MASGKMTQSVPLSWNDAVATIAQRPLGVVVIGPADVGKSTFIEHVLDALQDSGTSVPLIDLDPGQKMLGAPGTVGVGRDGVVQRQIFIGSTSASELSKIVRAAALLARSEPHGFVANTAGFVRGLGAKLQSLTIAALQPDVIVTMGSDEALRPITDAHPDIRVLHLERSEHARRKSQYRRAEHRQKAFAEALGGAALASFRPEELVFFPGPPRAGPGSVRPVCGLEDPCGTLVAIGVLVSEEPEVAIFTRAEAFSARLIHLGKMWAQPTPLGWKLLEELSPAWL